MGIMTTRRNAANGLYVDGLRRAQDTIAETTHNRLFHVQEGHDVKKLLDLQGSHRLFHLEETRHVGRQQVVAAALTTAIAPLCQTDYRIGMTASGQEQVCEGLRHVTMQVDGVIRHQEPYEQVPQAGRVLMVAKGLLDTLPERLCQVEFFNLRPA